MDETTRPISWLLLLDGHSVPLFGLEPEQLKESAERASMRDEPGVRNLRRQGRLNAIVQCLGFRGDFGNYCNDHWPAIQRLLQEHGLHTRVNLLAVAANDAYFTSRSRRSLADRLFFGPGRRPRRVFTGYGYDWDRWNMLWDDPSVGLEWFDIDEHFEPTSEEEALHWLYARRNRLSVCHNFRGNQLFQGDFPYSVERNVYWPNGVGLDDREPERRRDEKVYSVFRWLIERNLRGWVDVVETPGKSLLILKGPDGSYDLVWRNLREGPPPKADYATWAIPLAPIDRPSRLQVGEIFSAWCYYRQGFWEDDERHRAESFHYQSGGLAGIGYPGQEEVYERYLRHLGVFGEKPAYARAGEPLPGFVAVELADRLLLVSDLITIEDVRRMRAETGYPDRRVGDRWEPGNDHDDPRLPAAVTFWDAQAYCAWMERKLGVGVRLPFAAEYRAARPKRSREESGERVVEWLEAWSGQMGEPEACRFPEELEWRRVGDLMFLEADDFFEWTQERSTLNGWYDGWFGDKSWGAYKHVKVGFRLVVERVAG